MNEDRDAAYAESGCDDDTDKWCHDDERDGKGAERDCDADETKIVQWVGMQCDGVGWYAV
jgi:hypothetical protein